METNWRDERSSTPAKSHQLIHKFCEIRLVRKDADNIDINTLIDQLTSLRINAGSLDEKDVNLFIEHCCHLITPDLGQLGIKCCLLLAYLIKSSKAELTDAVLNLVVDHLTSFVSKFDRWAHPDILKALGAALYGRGGRLPLQALDDLVTPETGLLHKIIFDPASDILARKAALQCVTNLCRKCIPYLDDYYASQGLNIFLSVLKTRFPKADDYLQCRLLSSALKGIFEVTSNTKTAHGSLLGELLAALKAYNFFGRDDPSVEIPSCLHPTHTGMDVPASLINPSPPPRPQHKSTKKKTKSRRPKKDVDSDDGGGDNEYESSKSEMDQLLWRGMSGSESDCSDTESNGVTTKLHYYQTRVRQFSLLALCAVLKASLKRLVFGYWTSFLPTSPDDTAGTLAAILLNEPSTRVKNTALAAIAAFLDKSKSALLVATERETMSTLPFTPFSVLLGNMVKEVHTTLLNLLVSESSSLTITQTIKCLATVINNSPYQKLRPGLLSKSVRLVRPYLSHRDANIRVASLTCMGAVVTIHAPLLEVSHILLPPRQEDGLEYESVRSRGEGNSRSSVVNSLPGTPPSIPAAHPKAAGSGSHSKDGHILWLIKTCGRCVHSSTPGVTLQLPIRLEAMQVLSSLVTGYLPIIRSSLSYLTHILVQSLTDTDPSVQLHGAKTSYSLAYSIKKHFQREESQVSDQDDDTFSIEEALIFWNCLLSGPLVETLQQELDSQLRATCCDCLSSIGVQVFEAIETPQQIVCITMLLGLTSDPEPIVREAAARALGYYVLFPCQRLDVSFVADIANAVICCMKDDNPGVRIKASWAMANVTDALVLNLSQEDFSSFSDLFSDILLLKLFDVATDACYGDDKMKYNGVRALGSLLRYTQPKTLERRNMSEIVENSVKLLVKNLSQGVMKVRWNASYALGNLLQNDHLVVPSATWLEQVHSGLCLAMKNSKNFKVRVNASQALQAAGQRSKYGMPELFSSIWKYVIEAMDESTNTEDFIDYKHISSLSHQLAKTVLHLTSLIHTTDLLGIGAVLFSKEDTIKRFLNSASEPLDRTASLAHLNELKVMSLDAERLSVITTLLSIMAAPDLDDEEEQTQITTFRPSYD